MSASLAAITALIVALTGLVGAVTAMLAVLLKRAKKTQNLAKETQNLVNGHLTSLIDILQQADITLPSGAKIKYVPPNKIVDNPGETDELEEYLASLRGELNGD